MSRRIHARSYYCYNQVHHWFHKGTAEGTSPQRWHSWKDERGNMVKLG